MCKKSFLHFGLMLAAAFCIGMTSCSSSDDGGGSPQGTEATYTNSYFDVTGGTFHAEALPASTSEETLTNVDINERALTSGSNFVSISSTEVYDRFYVGVNGQNGYIEVPADQVTANAAITRADGVIIYIIAIIYGPGFNQDITMVLKGHKPNGEVTQPYTKEITWVPSIEGDLQVNLTFNNEKDIDLRLITPSGDEIYYGSRTRTLVDANGEIVRDAEGIAVTYGLDHDSNPSCSIDGLNNENIVIPEGGIEGGVYTVKVDMYSNCDRTIPSSWQLSVRYKGNLVQNLLPRRTTEENSVASQNKLTTIESTISDPRNPVYGTYPVEALSGDKTEVLKFQIKPATQSAPYRITRSYVPTLIDKAKMLDEAEGLNK